MRALAPTLGFLRSFAIVALLVAVAACSRTPSTGVGNLGPNGGAPGSQQEFLVTVGDRVFFGLDHYDISDEAKATLEKQATWLKQYANLNISVEGHADERGTREYNLALGERRANAVKNYLVALGIAPSRISTISYGKERPAVVGSNEAAWAQNRRGVTVVQ